jgi:phosphatidylglycerol lysyltransferase
MDVINASDYFVLIIALFMLITSAFLIKGLRNAWWIALILCIISLIGNLTKAFDYEETSISLTVMVMLVLSKKEYYIKDNPRLRFVGIETALLSMVAILVYGSIGFYFIDKRDFNIDFTWWQSIQYAFQNFFLIDGNDLVPTNLFAKNLLISIRASGLLSILFFFYTIIRPYVVKKFVTPEDIEKAKLLLQQFGKSTLDYFKIYWDKMIFIPDDLNTFISYRICGSFAVVLENPVAENQEQMKQCIKLFDKHCFKNGVKSIYYRVPDESLEVYKTLGKKSLLMGQEAIVDLNQFSIEGGNRKTLRNSVNKLLAEGFKSKFHKAPIKDGIMQKIKAVSDEWLTKTCRKEIIFSQGMFVWNELKQQNLLIIENSEEKIVAFLNIIPDYAKGEATYDLIRKTNDAPRGVMDFILIELIKYLKENDFQNLNMGFVPLSGIEYSQKTTEKSLSFLYNKMASFASYRGLRDFKEKFSPEWHNKYLVFDQDFDLLNVPGVLTKVIKP